MEQLLKKLKNAPKIKTEETEEERLKYIEEVGLNDLVNKDLIELYRVQPENPIYFLASFLINEDKTKKIKESIEKAKDAKIKVEQKQSKKMNINKNNLKNQRKKKKKKKKRQKIKRRNKIMRRLRIKIK